MKIEYLAEGTEECPFIRLYDFDADEATRLLHIFQALASGGEQRIALHEQSGFTAIGDCRLNLLVGSRDRGIVQVNSGDFTCTLREEGWLTVAGFTKPFGTEEDTRYQWLNDNGSIAFLLSIDGSW